MSALRALWPCSIFNEMLQHFPAMFFGKKNSYFWWDFMTISSHVCGNTNVYFWQDMVQFCAVIVATKSHTSDETSGHSPTMVWRQVAQNEIFSFFLRIFFKRQNLNIVVRLEAQCCCNTKLKSVPTVAIYLWFFRNVHSQLILAIKWQKFM